MNAQIRVCLAQINPVVGDIDGNAELIAERSRQASALGAQLVAFPELSLTGYPPEDLLLRRHFLDANERALTELARELADVPAVVAVGFAAYENDRVHNALALVHGGNALGVYRKVLLPNYGVFDEKRYFTPGNRAGIVEICGVGVGLTICEDIWERHSLPMSDAAASGAALLLNVSASPYHRAKGDFRREILAGRARDHNCHVALCALVGAQDELVFDGQSLVVAPNGELIARAEQFEPQLLVFDVAQPEQRSIAALPGTDLIARVDLSEPAANNAPLVVAEAMEPTRETYNALCLGLHDYVEKNGFEHVVFGLSGGIDSALTACIAVDALGPERVSVAIMPSPYSSTDTQRDAQELARNFGLETFELPIADLMESYEQALIDSFAGRASGVAEENIQARIRGNLVMGLSNKFGWLALTTGNKSEYAVGYTTLYGDMAGGFAVLKDVPKTLVYELARWRAARDDASIPQATIDRPPSAELRPDQHDTDSLPPYEQLDPILEGYIEQDLGPEQLVAQGHDPAVVSRVIGMVDASEYKRRQAPPGIKITPKAFGRDRRMPITNRFRDESVKP